MSKGVRSSLVKDPRFPVVNQFGGASGSAPDYRASSSHGFRCDTAHSLGCRTNEQRRSLCVVRERIGDVTKKFDMLGKAQLIAESSNSRKIIACA